MPAPLPAVPPRHTQPASAVVIVHRIHIPVPSLEPDSDGDHTPSEATAPACSQRRSPGSDGSFSAGHEQFSDETSGFL